MKKTIISALLVAFVFGTIPAQVAEAAPACPLTAGANETIVTFNGTTLFSNAEPRALAHAVSIPAGEYQITSVTWDDHAAHGGQNQQLESVYYVFYYSNSEWVQSGITNDIPESVNSVTDAMGTFTFTKPLISINVGHAFSGSGGYQSVIPLCMKFKRLDVPTTPVVALEGSCTASPTSVATGQNVTWSVSAAGGTGSYTYNWTGADTNGQTARSFTKTYSTTGTKTAVATITSGTQTMNVSCSTNVTTTPVNDLAVTCRVSDTTVDEGDSVDFTADATGGNSPYTYDWDWDIDGTRRVESYRFNRSGNYRARVTVTDEDGRTAQHVCPTVVVDNDNHNNDNDDLEIKCRVSDTTIDEGDYVTFSVDIDGGDSPYDIEWDGDISGDHRTERVRFNRDGRYEVDVTVRDDDGNRETDSCPIVRVSDDRGSNNNNDRNINVISRTTSSGSNNLGTPTGNLASVNSVFLSQVPYTGPQDVLKALGVLGFIAIWSTGAAIYFKRRRQHSAVSAKIAAFKEANKASRA